MSDIMEATGLTKGGIYGNFKREGVDKKGVKEEIAVAAFEYAVSFVGEQIRQRTSVVENTIDKLKTIVYFYKERILNLPLDGGCPIMNTAIEADDNIPALRKKVAEAMNYWHYGITRTIEIGKERGEIHPEVDAHVFATRFIGTLEGGILLSRIHKDVERFNIMAGQLLEMIEGIRKN
jgi:TetR/AcrR family transcriptional regulator, transcriptional repressor for nem operon